jgi:hypothetical protein
MVNSAKKVKTIWIGGARLSHLVISSLTSVLKMGSGEWGRRIFIVCCARNSWESCTIPNNPKVGTAHQRKNKLFFVVAGSAHPTDKSFVDNGAKSKFF